MEGPPTTARAPAVVAVVVTRDPGPWFDETLEALGAQEYENVSVLVLVSGGTQDPADRVAALLPDAYVRRLPGDRGFGVAVNQALEMVDGAAFFWLCHDDCAPDPDALHLLVEESFRSNAAVVVPKMVHWDDTRALLHVGQSADKTGAVVERVHDGEIDAGQHDAVRDVFVGPGGCTLVRADLLRALGGLDPGISAMGEDLELCWRAHVAGARVVVAPQARARHLELVAGGTRTPVQPPHAPQAPSLQALQRRHELRAVLTCYSWPYLVRVVPQALGLALAEIVLAVVAGDRQRARAVLHAWRWNLRSRRALRLRRRHVAAIRACSDAEVRSLQVRGSARVSAHFSRLTQHGMQVALDFRRNAQRAEPDGDEVPAQWPPPGHDQPVEEPSTGGFAPPAEPALAPFAGTLDLDDLDDLDDLGHFGRTAHRTGGRARLGVLGTPRARFLAWVLVAVVLFAGTRHLVGVTWPLVGQYLPFPSWTGAWARFFAQWQPAGVGSVAAASPAFAMLGTAGTVLFGRMGLLQEVVILGCVPLGAWGVSRLLRPFGSARGRFAGTFAYLLLPLAYDSIARGRWDALVAYALSPWLLGHLARASGEPPYGAAGDRAEGAGPPAWRRSLWGRMIVLGALEAVGISFAPAVALVVLVGGVGISLGSLAAGGRRADWRAAAVAGGGTVAACVLCIPWFVAVAGAGRSALSVLGLAGNPASLPGWGALLRMAVGPIGSSPLSWLLLAAALSPLAVARAERFTWAVRWLAVGACAYLLALDAAKAWTAPFAPSVDVLLAPAAVAVACGAGLGVAALDKDLASLRFGWRQGVAVLGVGAIVLGALPTVAAAGGGRWGAPVEGFAQAVPVRPGAGARTSAAVSGYRVLWLGDPQALPLGGWSIGPGLAYATSVDGLPTLADLWAPASPGPAAGLARDVEAAMRGETVELGGLLARDRVRYVVVVSALAPKTPGVQQVASFPAPVGLVDSLAAQEDLRALVIGTGGLAVFANTAPLAAGGRDASGIESPPRGGGSLLDPLGAAIELAVWLALLGAMLGRRRGVDWWREPLRRRRRRRTGAHVARTPAFAGGADGAAGGVSGLPSAPDALGPPGSEPPRRGAHAAGDGEPAAEPVPAGVGGAQPDAPRQRWRGGRS